MVPLKVEDVERLRAASGRIGSGIALMTSSEFFKSPNCKSKPESLAMDHHLSLESRNFGGSQIKKSAALAGSAKIIHLGVGRPNAKLYPWTSATFELSSASLAAQAVEEKDISQQLPGYDVPTALNYGNAVGSPPLVRFLTEHMEILHDPPYRNWGVVLTCGSTSSLEIALRVFCNSGETALCEECTYTGFYDVAKLVGVRIRGVAMDSEGLRCDKLEDLLSTWDLSDGPKPRLLYTIPSGQNPTGCTQSRVRKKAIYEVAEKHDLIIVEDDPYSYLNLGPMDDTGKDNESTWNLEQGEPTGYLSSITPSYLSIDNSGRVVRLDSTSKILSPGLRVGWVTANSHIINKFVAYNETDAVAPSGPSQLMLCELLEYSWGHRGFLSWLANLSLLYRRRRNLLHDALVKHLPLEICHWIPPSYGMFLWLRLDITKHPNFYRQMNLPGYEDSAEASNLEARIFATALGEGVQIARGSLFAVNPMPQNAIYLRLTYAAAKECELEQGVKILAHCVRKEFGLLGN